MAAITLTKENFAKEVYHSSKPVLVDFWAPWCGPCRMLSPVVEQVAQETDRSVKVAKVNIDDEPELAEQFGVMSIPMLMVVKNGKITASSVGLKTKHGVMKLLES